MVQPQLDANAGQTQLLSERARDAIGEALREAASAASTDDVEPHGGQLVAG